MTRAVFLGDSITGGLTEPPWTGIYYESPWPTMASEILGWEAHNLAVPGSGYTAGSGGLISEVVPEALALNPDVVILSAGVNDAQVDGGTYSGVETAVASVLASLADVERVFVLSPMPGQSGTGSGGIYGNTIRAQVGAAIQRAADSADRPYIDLLDPEQIYGTGTDAVPTGDGNADLYVLSDAIHLNQAGEDFIGRVIAREIARLWYATTTGIEAWVTTPASVYITALE